MIKGKLFACQSDKKIPLLVVMYMHRASSFCIGNQMISSAIWNK